MNHCFFYFRCMALRDLVKAVSPEFATDREIQGDQLTGQSDPQEIN
jgi:hypothetical protein